MGFTSETARIAGQKGGKNSYIKLTQEERSAKSINGAPAVRKLKQ